MACFTLFGEQVDMRFCFGTFEDVTDQVLIV